MHDSNNQCTRYLLNMALTCAQAMPYRDTLTWLGREENSSIIIVSSPSVCRNVCDLFKARGPVRKTNHLNAGSILVQRPRHFIKRQVMSMLHNVSGAGPTRGQCWLSATPHTPPFPRQNSYLSKHCTSSRCRESTRGSNDRLKTKWLQRLFFHVPRLPPCLESIHPLCATAPLSYHWLTTGIINHSNECFCLKDK